MCQSESVDWCDKNNNNALSGQLRLVQAGLADGEGNHASGGHVDEDAMINKEKRTLGVEHPGAFN